MTATEIAAALGGAHRCCRCLVHGSRGATLALRNGEQELIAVCHAACSLTDILGKLRRTNLPADHDGRAARRIALAGQIRDRVQDAREKPMADYLAGRCITIDPPLGAA